LIRDDPAKPNIAQVLTKAKVLGPRIYQDGIHLIREEPPKPATARAGPRTFQDGIHLIREDFY